MHASSHPDLIGCITQRLSEIIPRLNEIIPRLVEIIPRLGALTSPAKLSPLQV
jgi:hypothetical protein